MDYYSFEPIGKLLSFTGINKYTTIYSRVLILIFKLKSVNDTIKYVATHNKILIISIIHVCCFLNVKRLKRQLHCII